MDISNKTEIFTSSLYDSLYISDCAKENIMFEKPVGVEGKTLLDTNMILPFQLPIHNKFLVKELFIKCEYPCSFIFYVASGVYGEYKLWGSNKFAISRIFIESETNFYWKILSEYGCQKVFITMLGELSMRTY
jgi:hypothetical protein